MSCRVRTNTPSTVSAKLQSWWMFCPTFVCVRCSYSPGQRHNHGKEHPRDRETVQDVRGVTNVRMYVGFPFPFPFAALNPSRFHL